MNAEDNEDKKDSGVDMVAEIEEEAPKDTKEKEKEVEKEKAKDQEKEKAVEKKEEKTIDNTDNKLEIQPNDKPKGEAKLPEKIEPIFTLSNENRELFLQKVTKLSNIFTFTNKYSSQLVQLYKNFTEPYFLRISSTMTNDLKPYLKYIKEISLASGDYANALKKASTNIKPNPNNESHVIGKNMQSIVNHIQEQITETMTTFSSSMKTNLITNPQYVKYDATFSKLESHHKNLGKIIQKINHRQEKKQAFFKKNFETIFETYKNKYNEPNLANELAEMTDFILIEHRIVTIINKFFIKTGHFLNESLQDIKVMREILLETVKLLKETFDAFVEHNKKLLKDNIITSGGSIELFNQDIVEEKIKEKLAISDFLGENPQLIKEFNEVLSLYQDNFMQSTLVKSDKIYEDANFKIETYKTVDDFIDFLISLNPKACEINTVNLIEYQCTLKKDAGVFKGWKNCQLIVTKQHHAMLYDDDAIEKNLVLYNLEGLIVKPKKDKNKPYCFEISIAKGKNLVVLDAGTEEIFKLSTKALGMEEVVPEKTNEEKGNETKKEEETKEIKV